MTEESKRDEAIALRAANVSVRRIAARLGVPPSTVQDWTRTSEPRTADDIQAVSKEREAKAVALFKDGQSARQVGTELGISHMQVTRLLRRAGVMLALLVVASFGAPPAQAKKHYDPASMAMRAGANPFACQLTPHWGRRQNECAVRVTWRKHPILLREALLVVPCESGWNNHDGPAIGLFQFIGSTARTWSAWLYEHYAKYRVALKTHSVETLFTNPVWNSRAALGLRLSARRWSGPWYPSRYCHHLR